MYCRWKISYHILFTVNKYGPHIASRLHRGKNWCTKHQEINMYREYLQKCNTETSET